MARYEAGETLASIARTYDCSPPAISYVVSRSRARQPDIAAAAAANIAEPQLIKAAVPEVPVINGKLPGLGEPAVARAHAAANGQTRAGQLPAHVEAAPRREIAEPPREGNGIHRNGNGAGDRHATLPGLPPRAPLPVHRGAAAQPPTAQANGDRRTLHLSLTSPSHGNEPAHVSEAQPAERHDAGDYAPRPQHQAVADSPPPAAAVPERGLAELRPIAYQGPVRGGEADAARRPNAAGTFIDKELRARVDGDIAAFLTAFDAALLEDTQQSRSALREATDRLLRAGARTRIELERLEARTPLSPRAGGDRNEAAWRQR